MSDEERTAVTTYVPSYQKAEWEAHGDQLEMSQAEFVRTMVQAGRRGFEENPDSPGSSGSNPGGNMQETVLQAIEDNGPLSWNELREAVAGDLETRLEQAIVALQNEDEITHRPRDNSYVRGTDR